MKITLLIIDAGSSAITLRKSLICKKPLLRLSLFMPLFVVHKPVSGMELFEDKDICEKFAGHNWRDKTSSIVEKYIFEDDFVFNHESSHGSIMPFSREVNELKSDDKDSFVYNPYYNFQWRSRVNNTETPKFKAGMPYTIPWGPKAGRQRMRTKLCPVNGSGISLWDYNCIGHSGGSRLTA